MSLNIGTNTAQYANRATIWEVEVKDKFTSAKISTSRKDKRLPEGKQWVNTNWFATLVGDAHKKAGELKRGTRIEIINGTVSQESYEQDGEKKYPKAPKVTIFDFSILSQSEGGTPIDANSPAVDDDGDIPF